MDLQVREPKFYTYSQNNSGGSFIFSDTVTHFVIVEAYSASQADAIAENIGLYFDGCDTGDDCPCCGDRWFNAYGNGNTEPMIYASKPEEYECNWTPVGKAYCYVYRLNGVVDSYIQKPRLR